MATLIAAAVRSRGLVYWSVTMQSSVLPSGARHAGGQSWKTMGQTNKLTKGAAKSPTSTTRTKRDTITTFGRSVCPRRGVIAALGIQKKMGTGYSLGTEFVRERHTLNMWGQKIY